MGAALIRPTLFLLHALGSSGREWDEVVAALGDAYDCVPLDLPGFGNAAGSTDTDVAAMLDWLTAEIAFRDPAGWMVVGHSMGGKLATLIAARAVRGAAGLSAICGVVLLAGSPPAPEPMEEDRRAKMLAWADDGPIGEADAQDFIDANIANHLPAHRRARAVADVMRAAPAAWRAWLERGSREDWSGEMVRIDAPALLIAGAEDGDLDADAQVRLNLPHYGRGRVETVPDAAHLLPYEQPDVVARLIDSHWQLCAAYALPAETTRLLASSRVSARTRHALFTRRWPLPADAPTCLTSAQRQTLAAIALRILPGTGAGTSLARRLDASLAAGQGDGWRFADLPPDADAWRDGLDALAGFADLNEADQDRMLSKIADGSETGGNLSPHQMRLWFEDVRAETVRTWLSLPGTMARIGYDGFANGGDTARLQGFQETAADRIETWQRRQPDRVE